MRSNHLPPDLPSRLKHFREQRHLSKSDLADKAGITYRTVHNLESDPDRHPQDKTLLLLAKALEISLDELQGNGTEETHNTVKKGHRLILIPVTLVVLLALSAIMFVNNSISRVPWELTDNRHTLQTKLAGITLWRYQNEVDIRFCQEAPWSPDVLLIGLWHNSPQGGRLLALDRRTGKQLWEIQPDISQLQDVFGTEIVDAAAFGALRITAWDSDGDGTPEAVVQFVHGRYYPTALCAFNAEGKVTGQYNLYGHAYEMVAWDLNNDGRDELIVGGTYNPKAYMGAILTVLNREHFRGASIDSFAAPHPTMPDSALYRVVFPAYPEPFMSQMSDPRLSAHEIQFSRNAQGETTINIAVGYNPNERIIVYLDAELHPTGSDMVDIFTETQKSWPDSLTNGVGPGDDQWRADWLATHRWYEAGHWPPQ